MKVRAPGKLLVTGAYAVLEGAPALVLAVDRFAVADSSTLDDAPYAEVAAALAARAPRVDVSALRHGDLKLGLGSSAAAVVAALGAVAAGDGHALDRPEVRAKIFADALAAHARVQAGGSGVDVAASVHGGALRYAMGAPPKPLALPASLVWEAYFSGSSARTSDMRAKVDALRAVEPERYSALMGRLRELAAQAVDAASSADGDALVVAARAYGVALDALGGAAEAPIVTASVRELAGLAAKEGAAFLPSGAGGGDCSIWLGTRASSEAFRSRAVALGHTRIELRVDPHGVRLAS